MARGSRDSHLWNNYGMTLDQYQELLLIQKGVCAICGKGPTKSKSLAVDHDHETNLNRGLLCGNCNTGLGMFKDDVRLLAYAIVYLEKYGKSYS